MGSQRDLEKYGNYYWCVKVPVDISPDGEIYVYADTVKVTSDGTLEMMQDEAGIPNLVLARGSWIVVFAASVIDGHAVAVEHWEGEV